MIQQKKTHCLLAFVYANANSMIPWMKYKKTSARWRNPDDTKDMPRCVAIKILWSHVNMVILCKSIQCVIVVIGSHLYSLLNEPFYWVNLPKMDIYRFECDIWNHLKNASKRKKNECVTWKRREKNDLYDLKSISLSMPMERICYAWD